MNYWETVKAQKKVALEVGERVYIAFTDMLEEIEKEWREEGIFYRIVSVPGLLVHSYEAQPIR